jgi:hypothetical protein
MDDKFADLNCPEIQFIMAKGKTISPRKKKIDLQKEYASKMKTEANVCKLKKANSISPW